MCDWLLILFPAFADLKQQNTGNYWLTRTLSPSQLSSFRWAKALPTCDAAENRGVGWPPEGRLVVWGAVGGGMAGTKGVTGWDDVMAGSVLTDTAAVTLLL